MEERFVDVVFDGPPAAESGRFVEVEDHLGRSIQFGSWVQRPDGYWCLRLTAGDIAKVIEREPRDPPGWEGGFAPNH